MKKIKIAFIKFGGLAAGGTEKYLQTLACNLPRDEFEVDYYYTDAAPLMGNSWEHPDTDPERQKYMESHGIKLIKVICAARDDRRGPPYEWIGTDFWDLFDEDKYDLVQTGRSGYREFPFDRMENAKFIDSIHSEGATGIEKRENILKTVLLSEAQVARWLSNGGDPTKIEIISPLVEMPPLVESTLRKDNQIPNSAYIFGMHQGNRDDIYSPIPLEAYSLIENKDTMFVLLGGSEKYRHQARQLGIENIRFIDFTGDADKIHNFVSGVNVFAHGRLDGEVCSAAIIEALYHGKPVISHTAQNMGHAEQIKGCGFMAASATEYANYMVHLLKNQEVYDKLSTASSEKYKTLYSLDSCLMRYATLYKDVLNNAKTI